MLLRNKMASNWPLEANSYKFVSIVGKGSFSHVYKANRNDSLESVAIKVMDLENVSTSFEDILQVKVFPTCLPRRYHKETLIHTRKYKL